MKVRIHRGAHEVGGNCVEIEHDGARLVLDLGWPLGVAPDVGLALPTVTGLADGDDPSLLGVLLSHPHFDHYGLLAKVPRGVPVYLGEAFDYAQKRAIYLAKVTNDIENGRLKMIETTLLWDLRPLRTRPSQRERPPNCEEIRHRGELRRGSNLREHAAVLHDDGGMS